MGQGTQAQVVRLDLEVGLECVVLWATPTGDFDAIFVARSLAASMAVPSGTTSSTMPYSLAAAAPMGSATMASCLARMGPTKRCRAHRPPVSGLIE